jgi:uncharacterized protein (DUF4415 family)
MNAAKVSHVENVDEWESGHYGRDAAFVERASADNEAEVDKALNLQMISIRLQNQLLEDLKFIATAHGIGYQPLIRDVLQRFVVSEKKAILREVRKIERKPVSLKDKDHESVKTRTA